MGMLLHLLSLAKSKQVFSWETIAGVADDGFGLWFCERKALKTFTYILPLVGPFL